MGRYACTAYSQQAHWQSVCTHVPCLQHGIATSNMLIPSKCEGMRLMLNSGHQAGDHLAVPEPLGNAVCMVAVVALQHTNLISPLELHAANGAPTYTDCVTDQLGNTLHRTISTGMQALIFRLHGYEYMCSVQQLLKSLLQMQNLKQDSRPQGMSNQRHGLCHTDRQSRRDVTCTNANSSSHSQITGTSHAQASAAINSLLCAGLLAVVRLVLCICSLAQALHDVVGRPSAHHPHCVPQGLQLLHTHHLHFPPEKLYAHAPQSKTFLRHYTIRITRPNPTLHKLLQMTSSAWSTAHAD